MVTKRELAKGTVTGVGVMVLGLVLVAYGLVSAPAQAEEAAGNDPGVVTETTLPATPGATLPTTPETTLPAAPGTTVSTPSEAEPEAAPAVAAPAADPQVVAEPAGPPAACIPPLRLPGLRQDGSRGEQQPRVHGGERR